MCSRNLLICLLPKPLSDEQLEEEIIQCFQCLQLLADQVFISQWDQKNFEVTYLEELFKSWRSAPTVSCQSIPCDDQKNVFDEWNIL